MTRILSILLVLLFSVSSVGSAVHAIKAYDDEDLDPALRMPVRRLHPERRATLQSKAKLKEEKRKSKQAKKTKETLNREERLAKAAAEKRGEQYVSPEKRAAARATEKAHLDSLLAVEYTTPVYSYEQRMVWKNEPIVETTGELLPFFNRSKEAGLVLYLPNGVTLTNDNNDLFFYFYAEGAKPQELRLRSQYFADDPLAIERLQFTIDGFNYYFKPGKVERGKKGAKMFWETSDDKLSSSDKDLVYALAHCKKWARLTYIGANGFNHVRKLTKSQIQNFYHTLQLYRLLGGQL